MASLVSALDNHTPIQYGENAHKEYGWSHQLQESILQLSFQLTRTSDPSTHKTLAEKYRDLLHNTLGSTSMSTTKKTEYISVLYRMMLQTRDMIAGKGEYALFYILLGEWVRYSQSTSENLSNTKIAEELSLCALQSLVKLEDFEHPYGSWKDLKYFLNYLRDHVATPTERKNDTNSFIYWPVFKYVIKMFTEQLQKDVSTSSTSPTSLNARWIPREKSKKFGWQAKYIACKYYNEWIKSSTSTSLKTAQRKCLTHYRLLIAGLNRQLKTIQINQCNKTWSEIDFNKSATSITLARQKRAFQYVTKTGDERGTDKDRLACKANYEAYVESCKKGERNIKGARVGINELIKEALNILNYKGNTPKGTDVDTLNLQWREQSRKMGSLENFVAMVDTSGSMECDNGNPLHAAIGLGCRVAEHSKLGKRVLTFSAYPSWINLDNYPELVDMVSVLKRADWGMNTNFVSALKLIIDACIEQDLPPEEVKDLALIIFSDMQIDMADKNSSSMYETIKEMFANGGMRTSHKRPYTPPHIVFWNLRSTQGFPSLSTTKNVSMLSGYSAALLNNFCEKGMSAFEDCTPWNIFLDSLANERYNWGNERVNELFHFHLHFR